MVVSDRTCVCVYIKPKYVQLDFYSDRFSVLSSWVIIIIILDLIHHVMVKPGSVDAWIYESLV